MTVDGLPVLLPDRNYILIILSSPSTVIRQPSTKKPSIPEGFSINHWAFFLIIHSTHSRSATTRMSMCFFLLRLIGNHAFGGQQHTCNGSRIFKCNAGNLGRVNDTCLQ